MSHKKLGQYTDSAETMKALSAIRQKDVERIKRRIRIGDKVLYEVTVPTIEGYDRTARRRLEVTAKYRYIFEMRDPIARRKRYMSYKDLAVAQWQQALAGMD